MVTSHEIMPEFMAAQKPEKGDCIGYAKRPFIPTKPAQPGLSAHQLCPGQYRGATGQEKQASLDQGPMPGQKVFHEEKRRAGYSPNSHQKNAKIFLICSLFKNCLPYDDSCQRSQPSILAFHFPGF
jgi:hypothetical protein